MCGRFALTSPHAAVRAWFALDADHAFAPRYNIAPAQPILIVRSDEAATRRAALMRWGFAPNLRGRTSPPPFIINARAETIAERPSFRSAFRRRRCLVPADAFYEWRHDDEHVRGQPFIVRHRDGNVLALAGIWETWAGPNGEEVDTVCIVTTAAPAATAAVHPRCPAIIDPADFDTWLDADERLAPAAEDVLHRSATDLLICSPIDDLINAARNDGPEVQRPAAAARLGPVQGSLF